MLHSFYTGVENIFKRIALEIDGELPSGDYWHRQLLERMTEPGMSRPAVISAELSPFGRGTSGNFTTEPEVFLVNH